MVKGDDIVESRRVEESKTKLSAASRIYPGMQVTGVAIQEVESLNFSESFRQSFVFLVFQCFSFAFFRFEELQRKDTIQVPSILQSVPFAVKTGKR